MSEDRVPSNARRLGRFLGRRWRAVVTVLIIAVLVASPFVYKTIRDNSPESRRSSAGYEMVLWELREESRLSTSIDRYLRLTDPTEEMLSLSAREQGLAAQLDSMVESWREPGEATELTLEQLDRWEETHAEWESIAAELDVLYGDAAD